MVMSASSSSTLAVEQRPILVGVRLPTSRKPCTTHSLQLNHDTAASRKSGESSEATSEVISMFATTAGRSAARRDHRRGRRGFLGKAGARRDRGLPGPGCEWLRRHPATASSRRWPAAVGGRSIGTGSGCRRGSRCTYRTGPRSQARRCRQWRCATSGLRRRRNTRSPRRCGGVRRQTWLRRRARSGPRCRRARTGAAGRSSRPERSCPVGPVAPSFDVHPLFGDAEPSGSASIAAPQAYR